MTCYLLRLMGFSCLAPSIRDYGLSGSSAHPEITTWGWDEQFDLLGAWDYAVADPDGLLGGALPDSQVGLMGFSKGAYVTSNAFALETRVPAAWIDSGPAEGLYSMIKAVIHPYLYFLTPIVAYPVYFMADYASGNRLDKYQPLDLLRYCWPPTRKVAVAFASNDDTVPPSQNDALLHTLAGLPECYKVALLYTPDEECNGFKHHVHPFQRTEQFGHQLCEFWSTAFNQNMDTCGLDSLPLFHDSPYPHLGRATSASSSGLIWLGRP